MISLFVYYYCRVCVCVSVFREAERVLAAFVCAIHATRSLNNVRQQALKYQYYYVRTYSIQHVYL